MKTSTFYYCSRLLALAIVGTLSACSPEAGAPPSDTSGDPVAGGGDTSAGGYTASGGYTAPGGYTASGAAAPIIAGGGPTGGEGPAVGGSGLGTGGAVSVSDSTVTPCPGQTSIDVSSFAPCDCSGAVCVPLSLVPTESAGMLADCDATAKCVPIDYASLNGNFLSKSCRSILDAEGRCVSTCVPEVQRQIASLPQADCAADERCAPCFNPVDGIETGACSQGCDTGPTEPAKTFTPCGNNGPDGQPLGLCVPSTLLSPTQQTQLPDGLCPATFECAPKTRVMDQNARFAPCVSSGALGAMGACAPLYIVDADPQGFLLAQDTCPVGYKCAPCANPFTMMPTGACD